MSETDLQKLLENTEVSGLRLRVARWVESRPIQRLVLAAILLNAVILGLETSAAIMDQWGRLLVLLDNLCLGLFIIELALKLWTYRLLFWRNGCSGSSVS